MKITAATEQRPLVDDGSVHQQGMVSSASSSSAGSVEGECTRGRPDEASHSSSSP